MQNNIEETAFPCPVGQTTEDHQGMSLRDWFAGMAMQGLLASETEQNVKGYPELAEMAYKQANEMMEARKTFG